MTIAFGAIGARSAGGTTTLTVAHPSSVGAADLLICGRCIWNSTGTATDETGWTAGGDGSGGTGSTADNHTTRIRSDYRVAAGGETGSVTFDQGGTLSGAIGVMARYTKDAANQWDVQVSTGDDATHGANRSVTGATGFDYAVGDVIVAIVAVDTDAALTITSPTFTAAGVTFGTVNRRTTSAAGVTTGNDGNIEVFDAEVTAGSASGVGPSLAFTTATSQCGPVTFLRLRETPIPGPSIEVFETTTWTATTTPQSITIPDALTGDLIAVLYGGDTFNNTVTAAMVTTTAGSTGTWSEPEERFNAANQVWQSISVAEVTADGSVTVSLARTQPSGQVWGGYAARIRNHGGIGNHTWLAPGTSDAVSLTTSQDSLVLMLGIDWDHAATVALTPAGAVDVERNAGLTAVTWYAAYWRAQASGTRDYGMTTNGSSNVYGMVLLEVLAAADGTTTIGKDLGLVWDTRATLGDTLQAIWNTRAALGDTLELQWGIRTPVGDTLQATWDARAAVGDQLQLAWDTRAAVGDTLQLVWNVEVVGLTAVGKDLGLVWNALATVGDTVQALWDVRSTVGDTVQLVWDVEVVGATAVGKTLGLLWNTKTAAGKPLDVLWGVRTPVGDELATVWAIRTAVGDPLQLVWNTRTTAGDSLAIVWDTRAVAAGLLQLLWNVQTIIEAAPETIVSSIVESGGVTVVEPTAYVTVVDA